MDPDLERKKKKTAISQLSRRRFFLSLSHTPIYLSLNSFSTP